ncbi:tyrosine-type recombinase/integrase [Ruegeria sp. ANG10]|uniref:tyrosine-type recombinase/integrase n=1 Tax=Ruegeria sp. ANG10 TaxID=3042467 RepID=UPI0034573938
MKKELSNGFLSKLVPPESGRIEISDTKRAGLRLRVYPTRAAWMYEKRVKGGVKRKHTLGTYCTWSQPGKREEGTVGLSEARAIALEIEAEAARGFDRVLEAQEQRLIKERAAARTQTVQEVINLYSDLKLNNLKTGGERKRQLELALDAHLSEPFPSLTRTILQKAIDDKAKEGRLIMANRIRAALKAMTRWAWRREYIDQDPGSRLERATKERIRDRVLSLDEVREIWAKSFDTGDLWGPVIRLLILTVQRRGSIGGLELAELDLENSRFKKSVSQEKNDRGHTTHLSPPALAEVKAAIERLERRRAENGEVQKKRKRGRPPATSATIATPGYLFTTTGRTPVSGWSDMKESLDELLGDDFEPWRLHDFRTAFATHMAERGISESVVDRVLNHAATASKASAVSRVYNQAELLAERAVALDKWAELVTQESADVIAIGGNSNA